LLGLAPPEPGSVIRYAYLWADENARGREEGEKDRPALVLATSPRPDEGTSEVLVLAITHTPGAASEDAVPIPQGVKQRIGLDDSPSWIVTTEANAFIWPGPDIRPVPGRTPGTVVYGRIPDSLLRQVARSFLVNRDRQQSRRVVRTQ
jgi:hypothetical protein